MSRQSVGEIRVLLVDDNPDLVDVSSEFLTQEHDAITTLTATSADEALARLAEQSVDCLVSDYDMPGRDGLELLRDVRDSYPDLPFILYTGKGSEEIASEAISAGVTDYLQKRTGTDQYTVLANRIERAVSERRARDRQQEIERRLTTLVENLSGVAYRCRNERGWPFEYVSDGCEELTGYPASALEQGDVEWGEEVLHPEDRNDAWETVQTAIEEDEPFEVTYRIRRRDGEVRWCWERGRAVEEDGRNDTLEGFITDITPRKRREQELEAEREFTQTVLNALDDIFFVVDPTSNSLVRWNDRLAERTGYSDSELATMDATTLVADEDVEYVLDNLQSAVETGTATVEADIVTAEGERIPHEFRGTALYDEDDDLIGIGGVGRDVTERKEREESLERYRTLVESVGDPMYVLAVDGTIEMVNEAMLDHLGYDREELVGETAEYLMPAEDVERGKEIIAELLQSERESQTWEMCAEKRDGTRTLHENKAAILTDEAGEFTGSVGVVRDITERKERERELQLLETVIQAVGDPVYALDDEGHFTFVNEAMEEMTGYDAGTLVGEHIRQILPEEDVETGREQIRSLLDHPDERASTFEVVVQTVDGREIPCELHVGLLPDEDGEFHGTAGIVRDIERRKRREQRLEQFASVVSHDLRGPLNVILGRVDLARERSDLPELDAIEEAGERMEQLIEDLLTLARQGKTVGSVESVTLSTVAERAWQSVDAPEATFDGWVTLDVEADAERLQELLENLFRNAVDHGRDDVTVEMGRLDDDGFYVADDGSGIPEGKRPDVFDHGYSTDEEGTGFGLSIVRRIASAHGWTVEVTDSEAGGARFEFSV